MMPVPEPTLLRTATSTGGFRRLLAASACLATAAVRGEDFEAVAARTSPGYARQVQADGRPAVETYVFGQGGYWSGPVADPTVDRLEFLDVARPIAVALASQEYYPSRDAHSTQLLIMVYWGTTYAPENASESQAYILAQKKAQQEQDSNRSVADAQRVAGDGTPKSGTQPPAVQRALKVLNAQDQDAQSAALGVVVMENRFRDQADARNAAMLGFDSELTALTGQPGNPMVDFRRKTLVAELEEFRYFVVLMAYDYPLIVKQKQHKLLWESRLSIRQHTHAFDLTLPSMLAGAAPYFGQNTNGLIRTGFSAGTVAVGTVRDLGTVPDPGPKK